MSQDERSAQYDGWVSSDGHALLAQALARSKPLALSVRAVLDLWVASCTDAELQEALLLPPVGKDAPGKLLRCRIGRSSRERLVQAARNTRTRTNCAVDSLLRYMSLPKARPKCWVRLAESARASILGDKRGDGQ